MSKAEQIRDRVEVTVAALTSLLFGVSFGWNYGHDNQVVYMLGALRLVHPDILANDWFAAKTTHYHVAFKYLAAALIAASPAGFAVGIAQSLVIGAGMTALYFLIRELVTDRRHALPGFLILIALADVTRTRGPCATYLFDWILQPSTLGSAAFLVSVPFFVRKKWLASGIALGVSGLFHANYLILFFGAYSLAHLFLGKEEFKRRVLRQLGIPFLVLLLFTPMILSTALSKDAKEAQEIYATIRAPHHFVIAGREKEFLALIGMTLLGLGASIPLARNGKGPHARLGALIGALLLVVWTGVGLSAVLGLRQATQLFAWRIVPHVEILLAALASAAAARVLLDPIAGRRYGKVEVALLIAGLGALGLYSGSEKRKAVAAFAVGVALTVVIARFAYEAGGRFLPERIRAAARTGWQRAGTIVTAALALALAIALLVPELSEFRKHSNVFEGLPKNERSLYAWMQSNTPVDAVFLTPPSHESMRYHGQRSIVVDWKSNPIVPGELLEWKHRLEDVTGKRLGGAKDLDAYSTLDETRIATLRQRYGLSYVIVRTGKEREISGYKVAYSNGQFTVLDVRE